MKWILLIIGLVLIMGTAYAATPPTVYVDTDASGDYDCDGTDDHVQINQALAFVGNNAGYTTVHLNGSNTYWIDLTLNMCENTIFQGDSDAEIKLVANAGWAALVPMISNTTAESTNFTIKDFIIDGNSANNPESRGQGYYNMMYFYNCNNITVDNMRLEWSKGDGLKVSSGGAYEESKAHVTFTNNYVYKLGHDALYVLRLNNVTAANNDIHTRTNSAIRLTDSGNATVYNNTIYSSLDSEGSTGPGLEIDKNDGYTQQNIEIYNNTFHTLRGSGIWITNEDNVDIIRGYDVHIHHNTFYNVGQYGTDTGYSNAAITIGQSNNTIIENNIIDNGGHAGIKYYIRPHYYHINAAFTTIVQNNIIINNDGPPGPGAGIWNYNSTDHTFISYNNCFYDNTEVYNGTKITTSNDITSNPLLVDTANRDYHLKSNTGTWNPATSSWDTYTVHSPCIDAGNETSEYSLEPDPNGGVINIGRYGGTTYASKSDTTPPVDNSIKSSSPDSVSSSLKYLHVGQIGATNKYRSWIWFDLSGYAPTENIDSALLNLTWYYNSSSRNKSTNVSIYFPNVTVDTSYFSWNNSSDGVLWSNPGGDWLDANNVSMGNTPFDSVIIPNTVPDMARHSWDLTTLVQSIVNGSRANNGFFIIANETDTNYIAFSSLDNETEAHRPTLTITASNYTRVEFISPTLSNDSTTSHNYVEINASIELEGINLTSLTCNWNGTNYSQYNSSRVLHISFDNNSAIGDSSTVVVDVSASGNNGSFVNGTYGNWSSSGDWNGAMSLDGIDDNISLPMINISGAHTLSIRMYPTEDNLEYQGVFGSGQAADADGRYLIYFKDKEIRYQVSNGTAIHRVEWTVPTLFTWYDVKGEWDGTTNANGIKLYVDKVLRDTNTATFSSIDTYEFWYLGRDTYGINRHFAGMVDEARVDLWDWNQDEINQSYDSNLYKYNSTQWYFSSNQTNLIEGEYNYQIFANNIESDYRVVTLTTLYNISGVVTDNNGDTLNGVTVFDNATVDNNESYSAGNYSLVGYDNGTYNLSFTKSGYDTGYLEVTIDGADNTTASKQIFDNTPPGQVTGLTEDSKNQTTVNISWTVVSGADSYQIFRNTSSIGYTTNLYYNDTGLTENTNYGYEVRANDSYNNWGANSSELVVTTDGTVPTVSVPVLTPSTLHYNSTGSFNISWLVEHSSIGLNNTSVSMIWKPQHPDGFYNWSWRWITNQSPDGWRGDNRNLSVDPLNFETNDTITNNSIWEYSGCDENCTRTTISQINSTHSYVNVSGTVQDMVHLNSHYINRKENQEATKTTFEIYNNHDVVIKVFDPESYHGHDHIVSFYLNTAPFGALTPSSVVNAWIGNYSFNPDGAVDITDSPNGAFISSINNTDWLDHIYQPNETASYIRVFFNTSEVNINLTASPYYYVILKSSTPPSKSFNFNVTNAVTSTNKSFADLGVMHEGTGGGYTTYAYTPISFIDASHANMQWYTKLYVADNNGIWGNSTESITNIDVSVFPPTTPSICSFVYNGAIDSDMNGTYSGTYDVRVLTSTDPDGGTVTSNLTIHYKNETLIAVINNSIPGNGGDCVNVSFNSTAYYSDTEEYTFRVVATDDESSTSTYWLPVNFSLGLHVSGTVYGGDNIGLQDVSMTLGTYSTTTASDGTYLFTGISDGSHTLTSYKDGYGTLSKTVNVSGADVTGQDFYYDIIVDRGGGGGSGGDGIVRLINITGPDGEIIGKAIAIGKPGEALFTIDLISVSRLLSGIDAKNTWGFIAILSIISILAGLFDTSKTARPELLLIIGFVGMGLYAIYQSKLAVVIGFG